MDGLEPGLRATDPEGVADDGLEFVRVWQRQYLGRFSRGGTRFFRVRCGFGICFAEDSVNFLISIVS